VILVDTSIEVFRARRPLDLEVLHPDRDYTAIARVSALRERVL
jgi:hypothetical protein